MASSDFLYDPIILDEDDRPSHLQNDFPLIDAVLEHIVYPGLCAGIAILLLWAYLAGAL